MYHCKVCGKDLEASAFYPSYIRKHDWRCKTCYRTVRVPFKRKSLRIHPINPVTPERAHLRMLWKKQDEVKKRKPIEVLKRKVRYKVKDAMRNGKLTRGSCEVCKNVIVDAHHDDYAKPFDVRWMCRQHHADLHVAKRRVL